MLLKDKKRLGIGMLFLFSAIGLIVSLFNFFLPASPIRYTGGAELVSLTTLTMTLLSGLIYFFRHDHYRWIHVGVNMLMMVLLFGTLCAAYFLESRLLFIFILLAGCGWFIYVATWIKE